jgi:hypothetical protein
MIASLATSQNWKKSPGSDHCFFCDEISHCGNKKNPVRGAQRFFLGKKNTKVAIF